MPDSTAEEVPILIEEARSLIAAYTAGSLSVDRLAWQLKSAVNALGDAGWPRYYDLWEVWAEIEIENAVCLDRNLNPNQALLGSLFADFEAVLDDSRL
ncbi:hypothetical protein GR168_12185 [Gordonia sp. JH63]|uniref:hypothetical protein n=1 Tax=Gordonia sp. JH63 TaxID=2698900 RepID=UPI00131FD9C0|nr:hypothetical protein [Gordonia sp. JH63]QHD86054.1 hypothetical protein GR168_12185 [Gordonia sp. JH63]